MNPIRRLIVLCAAAATLVAGSATARERLIMPVPPDLPRTGAPEGVQAICVVGNPGPTAALGSIYPGDDVIYVLLKPSTCPACTSQSLNARAVIRAWITMGFQVNCSLPVDVSIVRAFGTTCLVPDPGQILMPPFRAQVAGNGIVEVPIEFPSPFPLENEAFLAINFVEPNPACSTQASQPFIGLRQGCPRCTFFEGYAGSIEDMCDIGGASPLIWADIDCVATEVRRRSWGDLKLIYR